jgi:predicted pyridoxine 5'-phosphate oxidase superfamily flavin-nucleotide-binding protein
MNLTPRMKNWITNLGVHIATADKNGFPTVIVTSTSVVDREYIIISLKPSQMKVIENNISENPYVALAPGLIGSIRAPYQFKGSAKISAGTLKIKVEEIYCTKPGAEAGIRLDTLGFENMNEFDKSRWTDFVPVTN